MTNQVHELAHRFHTDIQDWFSAEELAQIDDENRAYDAAGESCCATHNHSDPNMAMGDAFEAVTGHDVDGDSEEDCQLWGAAWSLARANGFSVAMVAASPAAAPVASSGPCPECKGTGWYVGFRERNPCSFGCPAE